MFKTFGDKTTKFYYDGTKLLCQENETDKLYFYYGTEGVTAFKYNGNVYHYKKDTLGNILGIYDENNCLIAKYVYDAWGNHKTFALNSSEWVDISGQTAYNENSILNEKLALLNPFRYRSYYYDVETKIYYLNARYYDPAIGRFLCPDDISYLDPTTLGGLNLYAYCNNDPVNYADPSGCFPVLACIFAATALVGLGLTIGGVASDNNTLTAVGLGITGVSALGAGSLAIAGAVATGAIATGVVGGVTAVAGLGSLGFMSAEIQEATGNGNWIMNSTGMSEGLYNGLLLGTASIATLGSIASFGMLATNPMTGFTKHGLTQALTRDGHGVARKAILNAVKHPIRVINQGAKGIKYVGKLATVVLNTAGKVITAWATTSAGWRNIIILCFILGLLNDNKNY